MNFDDGILKEHNKQPYISLMSDIEEYGKACAIHATGTGKMYLALKWLNDNKNEPFTFFAPTLTILNKFANLILMTYFEDNYEYLLNASIEEKLDVIRTLLNNKNINLLTYSKLNFMSDEEIRELPIKNVVVDEFHHLGADKWGEACDRFLRIHPECKLLGLSATPIRPSDNKNMVELLFDGRISTILNLEDAIGKILPYPHMVYGMYSFKEEIDSIEEKLDKKILSEDVRKQVKEKIKEARRLVEKADGVQEVFEETFSKFDLKKSKLIVFCSSIEDMKNKMNECKNWFKEGTNIRIQSVSSDEDYRENERIITSFENSSFDGVDLLFSVNMLNEGIHVKDLDGVIMLRPTSSNIVFLQQLGRALAINDTRKRPVVFDLVNNVELMRKDMEQYRNLMHSIGFDEASEKEPFAFEMHYKMIDILDYLNSVNRYYTSRRIREEIFLEYCKDPKHPNLENVKLSEIFIYHGKKINIGNMLEVARGQYKLRTSSVEEIKKSKLRPMSDEEVEFFEKLKIKWTSDFMTDLDKKIEIFKEYCKEYNVTMSDIKGLVVYKGYQLGTWISQFRVKYRKGTLTEEEKEKLDSIGFVYEPNRFVADEEKVKVLEEYCVVNKTNLKNVRYEEVYKGYRIGAWISTFKRKYNAMGDEESLKKLGNPLDSKIIETLERLGILWESKNLTIEDKKRILKMYYEEFGGLDSIKRNDEYNGYPVGDWLSDFRTKKANGTLDSNLEQFLDKLGMVWNASKEVPFEVKCQIIEEYMKKTGKDFSSIPYDEVYKGYKIGSWTSFFRAKYKARLQEEQGEKTRQVVPLTDEELDRLSLFEGFSVSVSKRLVEKKIGIIEMYCKKEAIDLSDFSSIPQEYDGYPIDKWVKELRSDMHQGNLENSEIERLNKLKMVWEIRLSFLAKLAVIDEYCKENNVTIKQINRTAVYKGYNIGNWIVLFKERLAIAIALKEGREVNSRNLTPLTKQEYEKLSKRDPNWMDSKYIPDKIKLKILVEYYNEYGSIANISQKETYKGYPIGNWISLYRKKEKEGKCDEDIKELLNKLQMKWGVKR